MMDEMLMRLRADAHARQLGRSRGWAKGPSDAAGSRRTSLALLLMVIGAPMLAAGILALPVALTGAALA